MSIPLTASTETFTPKCMAEFEGAPSFTFRHGTVLDKNAFAIALTEEGITFHPDQAIRARIISELKLMFESEGMERNIARLEQYWEALDELKLLRIEHGKQVLAILSELKDGETVELPPAPVLDFDEKEARDIELLIAQVNEESDWLRLMRKQNLRYQIEQPRLLMRMVIKDTSLPVAVRVKDGLLTKACIEEMLTALRNEAKRLGADPDMAEGQLQTKALLQFALTEDEEKNSSSPLSGSTPPEQSASKPSSGKMDPEPSKSSDPATSEAATGSSSSD